MRRYVTAVEPVGVLAVVAFACGLHRTPDNAVTGRSLRRGRPPPIRHLRRRNARRPPMPDGRWPQPSIRPTALSARPCPPRRLPDPGRVAKPGAARRPLPRRYEDPNNGLTAITEWFIDGRLGVETVSDAARAVLQLVRWLAQLAVPNPMARLASLLHDAREPGSVRGEPRAGPKRSQAGAPSAPGFQPAKPLAFQRQSPLMERNTRRHRSGFIRRRRTPHYVSSLPGRRTPPDCRAGPAEISVCPHSGYSRSRKGRESSRRVSPSLCCSLCPMRPRRWVYRPNRGRRSNAAAAARRAPAGHRAASHGAGVVRGQQGGGRLGGAPAALCSAAAANSVWPPCGWRRRNKKCRRCFSCLLNRFFKGSKHSNGCPARRRRR